MSHGGSRKVVIIALTMNGAIATAKLVAAIATMSGSMMAEAIHSYADCGNQGLLLLGAARAKRPADRNHPLGYGREAYFWAFMVAVVLFTVGGSFSIYEGIHKLLDPHELENWPVAVGVLVVALVLEGVSLAAALAAAKGVRGDRSLMAWARTSGDVDLIVVTFEDIAAQAGLAFALVAVLLTVWTGRTEYDAAGSIVVGLLLLVVAVFVGAQMRRLIVGWTADEPTYETLRRVWGEHDFDVLHAIAEWSGPNRITVAVKVRPHDLSMSAAALIERINAGERAVRAALPQVDWQFVEPDLHA